METNQPYLPHELIIQILLRLPVKSLIRFKCLCKSWFSLITHDPQFANSPFQLTAATPTCRILFISTPDLHDDFASVSLNLHFLLSESYSKLQIKGSCRGFILLHCTSRLYIWNPSTGFHKQIPVSPFGSNLDAEYFYGFGYDQSTDDYLVVSMSGDPSHFEFFSLRVNTWKQIEFFPYANPCEDKPNAGVLYNGAIHWLAYRYDLQKDVIVAFDLTERQLFDVYLPDEYTDTLDYCSLWVFGELLSFSAIDYGNNRDEIWVMKEYKVHSSWTKTLVLSIGSTPNESFSPLCCTKGGDIIGTDHDTGLVKYDDKGQLLEYHSYSHEFEVAVYTESLLSLPIESEQA
jgi:F-box interacting protein